MSSYIAGYLIIFAPLISAIICFLLPSRFSLTVYLTSAILIACLALKITPDLLVYGKLSNDINYGLISLASEFQYDVLGIFFIFLILFNKTVINIYYEDDIRNSINKEARKLFYTLTLLNLFGLVGIFSTNNLINLYAYIEIYSLTFYALMSISNQNNLTVLAFRYFTSGIIGSVLILVSFLSLIVISGQIKISLIINDIDYLLASNRKIAAILFISAIMGIIIKFFPIWLYLEKIKQNNFIANFLATSSLFIKANVGLYLIFKVIFFLFGTNFSFSKLHFPIFLFVIGSALIIINLIQILKYQNLKILTTHLCFINLGFALIGIGVGTKESVSAAFLYIINYSLVNLMTFLFASYLSRHFSDCNIKHLSLIRKTNFISSIPLKVIIFFIAGFPLTIFFLANWHLAYSVMSLNLTIFVLVLLAINYLVITKLTIKMANYFYFDYPEEVPLHNNSQRNFIYSTSFWIIVSIVLYFAFFANILMSISDNLSIYLLSNTI